MVFAQQVGADRRDQHVAGVATGAGRRCGRSCCSAARCGRSRSSGMALVILGPRDRSTIQTQRRSGRRGDVAGRVGLDRQPKGSSRIVGLRGWPPPPTREPDLGNASGGKHGGRTAVVVIGGGALAAACGRRVRDDAVRHRRRQRPRPCRRSRTASRPCWSATSTASAPPGACGPTPREVRDPTSTPPTRTPPTPSSRSPARCTCPTCANCC